MGWLRAVVVVFLVQVVACGDGAEEQTIGHQPLPASFRVEGESAVQAGDLSISCRFEWLYEVTGRPTVRDDGKREVPVQWGGDAQRTVLLPDGSGLSLWPHLFSPESYVLLDDAGGIELVSEVDLASPSAFYRELGRLQGTLAASGDGEGAWTCAPFGPGAAPEGAPVEDTTGVAAGVWFLTPLPLTMN